MSSGSSLFPGYNQVDEFGPDEDYESDEEVVYVTLDLGHEVEPSLVPNSAAYRLIGLDTPTPFLQLSGTIFKGEHRPLLGTELLFRDGEDELELSKKSVTHVGNTSHRVRFRPVELRPASAPVPTAPPAYPGGKGSGKGGGRNKGKKKLREEAWQWQETTDEMTGAVRPRERPHRGGRKRAVQIAVQESEDEAGPSFTANPASELTTDSSALLDQPASVEPMRRSSVGLGETAAIDKQDPLTNQNPHDAADDGDYMNVDDA